MKVFVGVNESGVAWWRGKQPMRKMKQLGLCEMEIFSVYDTDPSEANYMVERADLVYVPSPSGMDAVLEFLKYYQHGKRTVTDFDDNLYDCHPFNPGYKTLGLNEVKIRLPDGKEHELWKDGTKGFSVKDNRLRFNSYVDTLNIVDTITTTTDYLKAELSKNAERDSDDFVVIPNSIDFNLFKPFEKKLNTGNKIRIGWVASDSHILEGLLFRGIIERTLSRHPNVQFVVLGNMSEVRHNCRHFPIEWHQFVDLNVYPLKLASLELDIAICPLEDCNFNHSKSALKWSEMSAFSIPCVCSDVKAYSCVKDGEDGLLAKTVEDFVDKLSYLIDSPARRKEIGHFAFERNFEEFNLDKNVYKWFETFEKTMAKDRQLHYKGLPIPRNELVGVK